MTDPQKFRPAPAYGYCEVAPCDKAARATCESCGGHYCYGHLDHGAHSGRTGRVRPTST